MDTIWVIHKSSWLYWLDDTFWKSFQKAFSNRKSFEL